MLDKINKEVLLERLNNFKNQKLVTLENIQNPKFHRIRPLTNPFISNLYSSERPQGPTE